MLQSVASAASFRESLLHNSKIFFSKQERYTTDQHFWSDVSCCCTYAWMHDIYIYSDAGILVICDELKKNESDTIAKPSSGAGTWHTFWSVGSVGVSSCNSLIYSNETCDDPANDLVSLRLGLLCSWWFGRMISLLLGFILVRFTAYLLAWVAIFLLI